MVPMLNYRIKITGLFNAVNILAALFFLTACFNGADKAFGNLSEKLEGDWESSDNIKIFFHWDKKAGGLSGYSYSLTNDDTIFIKKINIYRQNDTLFLLLSDYNTGKYQSKKYFLKSDFLNNYRFKATDDFYPFYLEFDLSKNKWIYTQTNSRGNKEVKFNLKRKGN